MERFLRNCSLGAALLFASTAPGSAQSLANVEIVGLDYAFRAPASLPPGLTAFAFKNEGKVPHEVVLVRLKPGVVVDSLLKADDPARLRMIEFGGILIAGPGGAPLGRILVELTSGTYLLICNFQDAPDKPQHLSLGMLSVLQVK